MKSWSKISHFDGSTFLLTGYHRQTEGLNAGRVNYKVRLMGYRVMLSVKCSAVTHGLV